MARHFPAVRIALALCACVASSTYALDPWNAPPVRQSPLGVNTTGVTPCSAPSAVTCSNNDWVENCEADYIDPNNPSVDPCLSPVNYVLMAETQYQSTVSGAQTDAIFVPQSLNGVDGDLTFRIPTAGAETAPTAFTAADEFIASNPTPARAVMEARYGPMKLKQPNSSTATTWSNQELIAQYQAWNLQPTFFDFCTDANPGQQCTAYSRDPYTEGQNPIESCEDYVYRSYYSLERWVDAINACQGNTRCVVNVSLAGYTTKGVGQPPAIFRARPTNADGAYIYDKTDPQNHITKLIADGSIKPIEAAPFDDAFQITNMPKNGFYAGAEYLITPAIYSSMAAQGIDVVSLLNALVRGDQLYESGKGVPTSNGGYYLDANKKLHIGFYDEWDFHHFMNNATQTTTDGEAREYQRRLDEVHQAWVQLSNAGEQEACAYQKFLGILGTPCGPGMPDALGMVNPGDTQEYQGDNFSFDSIISQIAPSQLVSPPSFSGQVGFGANLQASNFPNFAAIQAANITSGAQAIPDNASAVTMGLISPNAVTQSVLLGALDLPAALVDSNSLAASELVEDIASSEARAADILANSGVLFVNTGLLGGLGNTGLGNLGNLGFNGANLGNATLSAATLSDTINPSASSTATFNTGVLTSIGLANAGAIDLGVGPGGAAARRIFPGSGASPPPPSLANYIDPWNPACGAPSNNCFSTSTLPLGVEQLQSTPWALGSSGFMVDVTWTTNPPRWTQDANGAPILDCTVNIDIDDAHGLLSHNDIYQSYLMWPALCQLTNVILKEWNRHEAGHPSCLDPNSYVCDWFAPSFVKRYVNNNLNYAAASKEVEYTYCKRWTGGGQLAPAAGQAADPNINVPATDPHNADRANLVNLRAVLDARAAAFEALMKTVPVLHNDVFGKTKTDGNGLGNSEFGGGYDYTLSWRAAVTRYNHNDYTSPPYDPAFDGNICRLGGNALASFDAYATLFGNNIPIITADVAVEANDADDGQQSGWADLTIADRAVFTFGGPPQCAGASTDLPGTNCCPATPDPNNPQPNCDSQSAPIFFTGSSGSYSDSDENSDKPQFVEAPFQVGWVTVTVKAGVLFDYGATVNFITTVPAQPGDANWCNPMLFAPSGQCTTPAWAGNAWEAKGQFQPTADLGVWVDADVSLAGIFGVGIEVDLILLGLGLPLTVDVKVAQDTADVQQGGCQISQTPAINFNADLDLTLNTLSGELDFYIIAFWAKVASFKIVSWAGFTTTFPIFRTKPVSIDLEELIPGSIYPPGHVDPSDAI